MFNRPSYILTNCDLVASDSMKSGSLRIARDRIAAIGETIQPASRDTVSDLGDALVYPGLINAHDHLELNLFPNIGQGPYANSYEWFDEVNSLRDNTVMTDVLEIPVEDRFLWGGYRNLLSGVTTVAHHNPYHRRLFNSNFPVRVLRRYRWSHSLKLAGTYGGRPDKEYGRTIEKEPFIIHLAEGVDNIAQRELVQLDRLDALGANTVVVHGVGLTGDDMLLMQDRQASLVWCPSSNLFMFNRTLDINAIPDGIPIALGTDSTLSGTPTLFDELRVAAAQESTTPLHLIAMVTTNPAKILDLPDRTGYLTESAPADMLILERLDDDPCLNLLTATPGAVRLLINAGYPQLGDLDFAPLFKHCGIPVEQILVEEKPKLIRKGFCSLLKRLEPHGISLPINVMCD